MSILCSLLRFPSPLPRLHHDMYSPVYGQDDFAEDDNGSYDEEPSFATAPPRSPSPPPVPTSQPAARISNSQSYAAHTPLVSSSATGTAPLLDAHLDDTAPLLDILRCLQLDKPSTSAAAAFPSATHPTGPPLLLHCKAMPQGLKLVVNRNKTLSARGYLKSNLFSHYQINTPPQQQQQQQQTDGQAVTMSTVNFTVSLRRLLSVLEVNAMGSRGMGGGGGGGGSSLFMRVMAGVESEASEVVLELTDEGSVTTCQLACLVQLEEDDETEQLQFASSQVIARGTIPVNQHSSSPSAYSYHTPAVYRTMLSLIR